MIMILLLISVFLILISVIGKKFDHSIKNELIIEKINPEDIDIFQSEFHKQFEISQEKLESLYAFDFSEMTQKLNHIESKIDKLHNEVTLLSSKEEKMMD